MTNPNESNIILNTNKRKLFFQLSEPRIKQSNKIIRYSLAF